MAVHAFIIGNDLNVQKLIVDILEITFSDIAIDRTTSAEGLFSKLKGKGFDYKLIILDCGGIRKVNEDIILDIRSKYPHLIERMIVLFDSIEEKPGDEVLLDIPYIIKPFSLDKFGELVKKVCVE